MKKLLSMFLAFMSLEAFAQDAYTVLEKVDANMSSTNRIFESSMIIHGRRSSRIITSRSYSAGTKQAFTEYLSPASEKGMKMLKLHKQLWIYSPATDRTIQISGHMLRQSVMGSDLSYEDMMDDRKLSEVYRPRIVGEETIGERQAWVLELTAKVDQVTYYSQKLWVDTERFVPLRQELYAKGGKLLKRMEMKDVMQLQGRWFPTTAIYKDVLKQGYGTEFRITTIKFDQQIPDYIFTKAALKQ